MQTSSPAPSTAAGAGKEVTGQEFLAFTLGSEEYGIDIRKSVV